MGARLRSDGRYGVGFLWRYPCVYDTLGPGGTPFMMMPRSLESLLQRRAHITDQIANLGDLRCGSITSTTGRCGKPNCHCHQPNQPGHGPNLRLTYKVQGKTITESLPNPAAMRKAEREIYEFRQYQGLHKEFLEVHAQICQMRPSEPDTLSKQEKKRSTRSSKKPR